jgi:putative redox protein
MTIGSVVTATATGQGRFQTRLDLPGGGIVADEPLDVGGLGTGPTPYQLLSAALAACTSMTLLLYAERKGWTLPPFEVEVAHSATGGHDRFERHLVFSAPLEPEQRQRLIDIADKCPVHRTLIRGYEVVTTAAAIAAESAEQHFQDMQAACTD